MSTLSRTIEIPLLVSRIVERKTEEAFGVMDEIKVEAGQAAGAAEGDISMADVKTLKRGDIVTGKVVKIDDQQILVDVAYKFDGIVTAKELSAISVSNIAEAVELGQEITCKVISVDDAKENLLLSKRAYEQETAWTRLREQMDAGTVLTAKVAEVVKGGLVVDVGVRGFIPASMVERHYVEDFSDYKGRTLRLKIKEIDQEKNKLILSQKDILDAEFDSQKKDRIASFAVGQELDGTVQRLTDFGAFIDLGGIDGLVHVSEIAWQHVGKPADVLSEGQAVRVKILKIEPSLEKVSLSIKAAKPGPWESASGKFNAGDIVTGTVKRIVSFGCFVELAPGVEGLVHISQLAHRHVGTVNEVVKEGQEVTVKVLEVHLAEKRISLSIKETEEAPARPEREPRQPRKEQTEISPALVKQEMTTNLGEQFGDALKKFK